MSSYLEYDTVTRASQDKQENQPRPLICLSTKNLLRVENEHEQYHEGDWLLGRSHLTAEEVFELVAPSFSDLIKAIKIQRTLFAIGDEYTYVDIDAENETELGENGLLISRCDYYEYLKCFCIALEREIYPHGVQGFTLIPKTDIRTFVVAPGRFYDFSRKLTTIEIETNFSYEYVIDYNIYNLINLDNKPCRPELNWREDECKLTQVRWEVMAVPANPDHDVQLTALVSSQYNCTSPWFLYFARFLYNHCSDLDICQFRSQGSSLPVCGPEHSWNVSQAYYDFRYRSYPQCQNPCTMMGVNTLFTFKSSTEGWQQIKFTFIREIQVTEEKLKVEIETMIANIGGYLGMILGTTCPLFDKKKIPTSLDFQESP